MIKGTRLVPRKLFAQVRRSAHRPLWKRSGERGAATVKFPGYEETAFGTASANLLNEVLRDLSSECMDTGGGSYGYCVSARSTELGGAREVRPALRPVDQNMADRLGLRLEVKKLVYVYWGK